MVAGNDAHEITRTVSLEHECLEHAGDILAQLCGDVRRRQVVFVDLVGYHFVCALRTVEQSRGIGLLYLLRHGHLS